MDEIESIFDNCDEPNCAVHTRTDVEEWDVETEDIHMITYCGEYVVYTGCNPMFDSQLLQALWVQTRGTKPPKWITRVVKCGEEGAIGDCLEVVTGNLLNVYWVQEYRSFDGVFDSHGMVVDALENDMLDLTEEVTRDMDE